MSTGSSELVVIRTYLTRIDAELAQSVLDAADIDALVQADDAGGMRPGLWMSGVRLLVPAEDSDRANVVLGKAN
jgi:hypothetical protein